MIDGTSVEFVGEISDAEKSDFLSGAVALLAPISWPEPFGLVMIEAMACGTPVVVFNQGSAREIIVPGVTGFVVNDEAEAVTAVPLASQISRAAIRRCFEQRFTARRMAEDYLTVYGQLSSPIHQQRSVGSWPELMTWWRGDPAEDNHLSCRRVDAEGSWSSDVQSGKAYWRISPSTQLERSMSP